MEICILKSYRISFTKCVEEETYIASHGGEVLNSKSECQSAKVIRTTTRVIQGGSVILGQLGGDQGAGQGQGQDPGQGPQVQGRGGGRRTRSH